MKNEREHLKLLEKIKIIYSPSNAFEKITENPKYIGPLLIFILIVAVGILSMSTFYSKVYFEKTIPDFLGVKYDEWTENSTYWISDPQPKNDTDAIYGNYSISFHKENASRLTAELPLPQTINCSGPESLKNISLSLKWICSPQDALFNATLYLFSDSSRFFAYNLTEEIAQQDTWLNITLPLGGEEWKEVNDPEWEKITGLKVEFELGQGENANATLKIDRLFFRGNEAPLIGYNVTYYLAGITSYFATYVIFFWIVLGSSLYIFSRFVNKSLTWKLNLVIAGYSLVALFFYMVFITILFQLPNRIYVITPVKIITFDEGAIISDVAYYSQFAFYMWGLLLCTLGLNASEIPKNRSPFIALIAYIITLLVTRFLLGLSLF